MPPTHIVGRADFRAAGEAAQRASITVLTNGAPAGGARSCRSPRRCVSMSRASLPRSPASTGSSSIRPAKRMPRSFACSAPYEQRGSMFENFFHAGSLDYPDGRARAHPRGRCGGSDRRRRARRSPRDPRADRRGRLSGHAELGRERGGAARCARRRGPAQGPAAVRPATRRWRRSQHPVPMCRSTRPTRCSASGTGSAFRPVDPSRPEPQRAGKDRTRCTRNRCGSAARSRVPSSRGNS